MNTDPPPRTACRPVLSALGGVRRIAFGAFRVVLAFLFPDSCLACGEALKPSQRHICRRCLTAMPIALRSLTISHGEANAVGAPEGELRRVTEVLFATDYSGAARSLLHALKYGGRASAAELCAKILARAGAGGPLCARFELIVPVPLHHVRHRERGFNQAELIARWLSRLAGNTRVERAVRRVRATPSQTELGRNHRWHNVAGAFSAEPALASGVRVLLVDDIVTTGATMASAADALLDAGAAEVVCLAVAASPKPVDTQEGAD